jgi:HPt (histidine-containing phosphotransfer) domain-containing protein
VALERLQATMGEAFVAELIDAFLEDAPQMVRTLRQALAQGDAVTLGQAAHTLKSNSAHFGALTLSELCKALEAMGKAGALDGAAECVAQVEAEYAKVGSALAAVRQGVGHES